MLCVAVSASSSVMVGNLFSLTMLCYPDRVHMGECPHIRGISLIYILRCLTQVSNAEGMATSNDITHIKPDMPSNPSIDLSMASDASNAVLSALASAAAE